MARLTFLVTGARAPVALHLARLLHVAGHRVHLADSLHRPLAAGSRLHQGYQRLPAFRTDLPAVAEALKDLIARLNVDLVIPTCEEVLSLAQIWRDNDMPAPLLAPGLAKLEEVHNKYRFIGLCRRLGLEAPRTRILWTRDDVTTLGIGRRSSALCRPD